ncbi:MAG: polyprenol monophosphomannose synthase [Parcubacteria group bacterium]|nr:polyprenol monophosphomannose synthase [Parcubacteria group bacterium]
MPRTIIVTPTYNEKDNLPELVDRIFSLGLNDIKLVVVDDNSPDGTAQVAEELAQKYPLDLIRRQQKSGLGTAYTAAFKKTIPEQPDYIIQMDADLSHDPNIIPQMLQEIQKCDLVLGSRYVKGGKIENWNFTRRLVSRWGNFYARLILGLPYRDLTSGFKCFRREVLEKINLDKLSSVGYNFQIETTYRAHRLGCRICEIPITFTERKTGVSKFNLGIILESFVKVLLLRLRG